MTKRTAALAALLIVPLALGACSSDKTISGDDVAEQAEENASAGGADVDVTCDDDIEGKVGEEITCDFSGSDNGGVEAEGTVIASVEEVDDDSASLSFEFVYADE